MFNRADFKSEDEFKEFQRIFKKSEDIRKMDVKLSISKRSIEICLDYMLTGITDKKIKLYAYNFAKRNNLNLKELKEYDSNSG
ncbi:MAG: hypothetical protein ACFFDH_00450 [Promethearchaeota archaeon]